MHRRNATLVVIEFGASWPRWLDPGAIGDTAVVAQHYEGPPESLITQVESRVSRLTAAGWRFEDVVLVSNGRADLDSLAARSFLARELLTFLRGVGGARLLFTVAAELGRRASQTLTALGEALRYQALANGVSMYVRIGDLAPVTTLARASS